MVRWGTFTFFPAVGWSAPAIAQSHMDARARRIGGIVHDELCFSMVPLALYTFFCGASK